MDFTVPSEIKWGQNAAGTNESAVLFGDPSKPGPYVVRSKWLPGNMSRPHFHPNDRFFVVTLRHRGGWAPARRSIPRRTVPAPAGSYVIHYGGKVHYDGAKNEETDHPGLGHGPGDVHAGREALTMQFGLLHDAAAPAPSGVRRCGYQRDVDQIVLADRLGLPRGLGRRAPDRALGERAGPRSAASPRRWR